MRTRRLMPSLLGSIQARTVHFGATKEEEDARAAGKLRLSPVVECSPVTAVDRWRVSCAMVVEPKRQPAFLRLHCDTVMEGEEVQQVTSSPMSPTEAFALADLLMRAAEQCLKADRKPYSDGVTIPPISAGATTTVAKNKPKKKRGCVNGPRP